MIEIYILYGIIGAGAGSLYSINEDLVLWARSEIIDSALFNNEFLNPKHEIRKPKQYRMTNIKMIQTKDIPSAVM
jgi:hypothetical protein